MSHITFSGFQGIWAQKDGDYVYKNYPGTGVGLQDAIDYLAGGKGEVVIGPGTLLTTTAIWVHSGCRIRGAGVGRTIIKRSAMSNTDANNSGGVLVAGQYGSNGTIYTSSITGSDIEIMDLTLDGSCDTLTGITNASLLCAGFWARYVDGVRVHNVRVKNTYGDGFRVEFCRNASVTKVSTYNTGYFGTIGVLAAANAVNFIGDGAASGAWGYNYELIGAQLVTTGDEAIQASQINNLTIDDILVDGCDFVFECSPAGGTTAGTFYNWSISNIVAVNALSYFISFNIGQGGAYVLQDVSFDNCHFRGHATLHDGGCWVLPSTAGFYIDGMSLQNCTFRNVNTLDTTSRNWFDSRTVDTTGHKNITFNNVRAFGKSGSVRATVDCGINFRGAHQNVSLINVYLKDVPGRGLHISDNDVITSPVMKNFWLTDVVIENCNDTAFQILSTSGTCTGTIQDVVLQNCVAINACLVTGSIPMFRIYIDQAGATIKRISFRNCRTIKTTGSANFGMTILRSAGTVDDIEMTHCNFQIAAGTDGMFWDAGVTNAHVRTRPGFGAAITAAATIAIPIDGDVFYVNGNTNITNGITVRAWDKGRVVTLVFTGTPTVSDTGTSKLNGNLVATADDTLSLVCDGTSWFEIARSAN